MTKPRIPNLRPSVPLLAGNVTVAASPAWTDDRRGSRHQRGYGTAWDKLRLKILERDGHVCQCADCQGGDLRFRQATHVDHRVSKAEWQITYGSLDGVDDPSNLQAINADCHRKKTDADRRRAYENHTGGGSVAF